MKNVLLEITDTVDGLHSRLDPAEEKQAYWMTGPSEEIRCNAGQRDEERKYGRQSKNAQHSLLEERTEGMEDSQI